MIGGSIMLGICDSRDPYIFFCVIFGEMSDQTVYIRPPIILTGHYRLFGIVYHI